MYSLVNYVGFGFPGNYLMYSVILIYIELMLSCLLILFTILYLLDYSLSIFNLDINTLPWNFKASSESFLDLLYLVFPICCVIYTLGPALAFLYNDVSFNNLNPLFEISVCGRQWYWTYSYNYNLYNYMVFYYLSDLISSHNFLSFDSILNIDYIENRLLDVDNRLVIPVNFPVLISITSSDVIHSFALPQLGVKIDAIPGRVGQTLLCSNITGTFYGQCSELCGVFHGYMPIALDVYDYSSFVTWFTLSLSFSPSVSICSLLYFNNVLYI